MNFEDFIPFVRRLQHVHNCGLLYWRLAVVSVAWYPIGRWGQAALSRRPSPLSDGQSFF